MYLSIGKTKILPEENIIGIFDLDTSSQASATREFLSRAEKKGCVENAAEDIPNSFLITEENGNQRVYLSQSTSRTLAKRSEQMQTERRNTWPKTVN